jgi:hypothetical protein
MKRFFSLLGFLCIFSVLFVYFVTQNPHMYSVNNSHANHGVVHIPSEYTPPSLEIHVMEDYSGSWLLKVDTENFTFSPEKVGLREPSYNEGHAHLYVNGEKINRLYGSYYNLGNLKRGKNEIKVSLHSNNHGALMYEGSLIAQQTVVYSE